jgi:peptidoglycan-N-acetylglucosamine deacetylase
VSKGGWHPRRLSTLRVARKVLFAVALTATTTPAVTTAALAAPEPAPGVADAAVQYRPDAVSLLPTSPEQNNVLADQPCTAGSLVRRGKPDKPWVAITFDDGPDSTASRVMNAFGAHGASGAAEFFLIGRMVQAHPDAAMEIAARGYGISNHSVTHSFNPATIAAEIGQNQDLIYGITGVVPRFFRSPGLTQSPIIQSRLAEVGMCNVFTDTDEHDWLSPRLSPTAICTNVERDAKPGSIILLHATAAHPQTLAAVETCLFPVLERLGLQAKSLEEVLTGVDKVGTRVPAGGKVAIHAGQPFQTVVGQLTVDRATGGGYLTAFPCSDGQPDTSDVNYTRNAPTTNLLIVRLDAQGMFCVAANGAATDVIYDQTAEVPPDALALHNPLRVLDTRANGGAKAAPGSILRVHVAGADQIVVGQLTSDRADQAGYMTAFTCDGPLPNTSNLNTFPGIITSNRYVAQADANGDVCYFTSSGTHLVIDQSAEWAPGTLNFDAERLADTRGSVGPLPAGGEIAIAAGHPDQTVFGQMTVDGSRQDGYGTLYPCEQGRPGTSNVNFGTGRPRSSSFVVPTDHAGNVCVYVSGSTNVIFDEHSPRPPSSLIHRHACSTPAPTRAPDHAASATHRDHEANSTVSSRRR